MIADKIIYLFFVTGAPIPYMGLQEYYKIGSLVTSTGMGGLGSTETCFRVDDVFYEPTR